MNKRMFKTSVGYAVNSLLPILSWILWGVLIDKDLSATFSLTYPLQMLWSLIYDIFGYGCYSLTIKDKDSSEDYFQSGLILGSIVYLIMFGLVIVFHRDYITAMGYLDEKYIPCCLFSMMTFITCGISTLCSLYYSFKEDEKKASNILIFYNFCVYISLIVALFVTRNSYYSALFSVIIAVLCTIFIFTKTVKRVKIKFDVLKGVNYIQGELVASVGMFIIYFFGIGKMMYNDFRIAFTFSIWTQITDWVWDVLCNLIPIIIRVDTAKGRFDFKKSCKDIFKVFGVLFLIIICESLVAINIFELNLKYLLFFACMDMFDMLLYLPRRILNSSLSMKGYSGRMAIIEVLSYSLRVFLSLSLPVRIAVYTAQAVSALFKTLLLFIFNKKVEK